MSPAPKKYFGFEAEMPFEEGLRRTIEWFRENQEQYCIVYTDTERTWLTLQPSRLNLLKIMTETSTYNPDSSRDIITLRPSQRLVRTQFARSLGLPGIDLFPDLARCHRRYKQTVLGAAWAVINPLINMIVFQVVFGNFAGMEAEGGYSRPIIPFCGCASLGVVFQCIGVSWALDVVQPLDPHQGIFPTLDHPTVFGVERIG